jgi:hypothetical protein
MPGVSVQTIMKVAAARGEHISLESDDAFESRGVPDPTQTVSKYRLSKGGRNVTTGVFILRDQFVLVESQRAGKAVDRFTVDLRFVDPRPFAVRKVTRPVLYATLIVAALTATMAGLLAWFPALASAIGGYWTFAGLSALTIGGLGLAWSMTRESLLFVSVHGRARVLNLTGRIGTMRRVRPCAAEIVKQINIARRQFTQTRQAFLRDEMREHTRLHEQGVLTNEQFNTAKLQILRAHE